MSIIPSYPNEIFLPFPIFLVHYCQLIGPNGLIDLVSNQNGPFIFKILKEPNLPTEHKSTNTLKNIICPIPLIYLISSWMQMSTNSKKFGRGFSSKNPRLGPVAAMSPAIIQMLILWQQLRVSKNSGKMHFLIVSKVQKHIFCYLKKGENPFLH